MVQNRVAKIYKTVKTKKMCIPGFKFGHKMCYNQADTNVSVHW